MNFYKHYIGDFQRDTGHLSLTERGAYLALIHHYYATEKPLPTDHTSLCRIAGAITRQERDAVKAVMSFFERVESGLMHSRIEAELQKAGAVSDTNREIALAREAKRRAEKEARNEHEQSTKRAPSVPRSEHEQSTNQTPDTREEQIPPQPPVPGGEPSSDLPSNKRERKPRISLKTFLDRCQQAGEKAVSDYAPLLEYVEATALPMDFVQLAWDHFKREHLPPGANHARLQADWRRHFLTYVEKGYYRLWYAKPDGGYDLTTVGIQAQRLHAAGAEHAA